MSQLPIDDMDEDITILYSSLPGDSKGNPRKRKFTQGSSNTPEYTPSYPTYSSDVDSLPENSTSGEAALPSSANADKQEIHTDFHDILDEELTIVKSRHQSLTHNWQDISDNIDFLTITLFRHRNKPYLWKQLGIERELPPGYLDKMAKAASLLENLSNIICNDMLKMSMKINGTLKPLSAKHKGCLKGITKEECHPDDVMILKGIRQDLLTLDVQQEKLRTAVEIVERNLFYLDELNPEDQTIDVNRMNAVHFDFNKDTILAVDFHEEVITEMDYVAIRTRNVANLQKHLLSSMLTYREHLDAHRTDLCACKEKELNITNEVYHENINKISSMVNDGRLNLRNVYHMVTALQKSLKSFKETEGPTKFGAKVELKKLRHAVCDIEAIHRKLLHVEKKIKENMEELFPERSNFMLCSADADMKDISSRLPVTTGLNQEQLILTKACIFDTDYHDLIDSEISCGMGEMNSLMLQKNDLGNLLEHLSSAMFANRNQANDSDYRTRWEKTATLLDKLRGYSVDLNQKADIVAADLTGLSAKHEPCLTLIAKEPLSNEDVTNFKKGIHDLRYLEARYKKLHAAATVFNDKHLGYLENPSIDSATLLDLTKDNLLLDIHPNDVFRMEGEWLCVRNEQSQQLNEALCKTLSNYEGHLRGEPCTCKPPVDISTVTSETVGNLSVMIADMRNIISELGSMIPDCQNRLQRFKMHSGVVEERKDKLEEIRSDVFTIIAKRQKLVNAEGELETKMRAAFPGWTSQ